MDRGAVIIFLHSLFERFFLSVCLFLCLTPAQLNTVLFWAWVPPQVVWYHLWWVFTHRVRRQQQVDVRTLQTPDRSKRITLSCQSLSHFVSWDTLNTPLTLYCGLIRLCWSLDCTFDIETYSIKAHCGQLRRWFLNNLISPIAYMCVALRESYLI